MHLSARTISARLFRGPLLPAFAALVLGAALFSSACGGGGGAKTPAVGQTPQLSGNIEGDGSSTVFPITEAVAEEFRKVQPDVDVTVGISGTGGGFKKFCNGEIDFSDASRPIKDEEKTACAGKGIEYVEFEIAFDGLSVMVHPDSDFVDCLTVAELKSIWAPGSTIKNWKDVRSGFPDKPLSLYGPDTDSGTFDYFTEVINGKAKDSRADYTASADDNALVQGIAGDENALGYFGFAYYEANTDKLKLLGVDPGSGCVEPSREAILNETYAPLSRPLLVYVRKDALERPEVQGFMRFYLDNGKALVDEVGYVEVPDAVYQEGLAKIP